MDWSLPDWLNEEFTRKCLQAEEGFGEEIVVTKLRGTPAAPLGNNYGSKVFRVNVEFKARENVEEVQNVSLIVKSPLTGAVESDIFGFIKDTEYLFYYTFLTEVSRITEQDFAPRPLFSPVSPAVVLEDLKEQGFVMADRCLQLDFEHCLLYALKSASFHATSVAVLKRHPEMIESLGTEKMFSNDLKISQIYRSVIPQVLELVSDVMNETELKRYSHVVNKVSTKLFDLVVDAHKPSLVLNCLNQGDPWTTNMMFRYVDGRVKEIKLLDFQVFRYGSPVNDLVFFLWTSAKHEVREDRWEELFHAYCDALNTKLEELGCTERLSYDELLEGMKRLSPLVLLLVSVMVPFLVNPDNLDLNDVLSNEEEKQLKKNNLLVRGAYYEHHMSRHLKQLESMGVFSYLEINLS